MKPLPEEFPGVVRAGDAVEARAPTRPTGLEDLPVLGVCGWSGAGKTTLIERLIPLLRADGLDVAVVKHDAHGVQVDRPGKDSDRFFRAGADVVLRGPGEVFGRMHRCWRETLARTVRRLAGLYDVVLVEGHKDTPLPKVWLLAPGESAPPAEVGSVLASWPREADRLRLALGLIEGRLAARVSRTPVMACVTGPDDATPAALAATVRQLARHTARVLVATEDAARLPGGCAPLPPAPGASGDVACVLAAMRWAPRASWLVVPADMSRWPEEALERLLAARRPGAWVIMPAGGASAGASLPAWLDPRARTLLEDLAAAGTADLAALAAGPKFLPLPLPRSQHSTARPQAV